MNKQWFSERHGFETHRPRLKQQIWGFGKEPNEGKDGKVMWELEIFKNFFASATGSVLHNKVVHQMYIFMAPNL